MSAGASEGRTAAELQIENLKRLKALQKGTGAGKPSAAARPAASHPQPEEAIAPAGRSGLAVTEIIDLGPATQAKRTPAERKPRAALAGTRIVVDTALYKRLRAKWRLERRFQSEREYWDWALQTLLSWPVDRSDPF